MRRHALGMEPDQAVSNDVGQLLSAPPVGDVADMRPRAPDASGDFCLRHAGLLEVTDEFCPVHEP